MINLAAARERGQIKQLQKLPYTHPLHMLWTLCREPQTTLFKPHQVQRDDSHPSTTVNVPSSCLVLAVQGWIHYLHPNANFSAILLREEYREALRGLMAWFSEGKYVIPTEVAVGEDAMQVDGALPAPFLNPFLAISSGALPANGPFVLLGDPGAGKTLFLYVLLVLRLQTRLPTIYQYRQSHLLYFAEDGVFQLNFYGCVIATEFRSQVSRHTWCLIDCNLDITTVPMFIQDLRLFIIQSSAPRWDHLKWTTKHSRASMHYFLKPWTLSELFVGRSLQHNACSEKQIEAFCTRYGTSARLAYGRASHIELYDIYLTTDLNAITDKTLDNIVRQCASLDFLHSVSDEFLEISPGTTRNDFELTIPTRYLYEKLRRALYMPKLKAAACLYATFSRISNTRNAAGYMLDDAVNDVFHTGGQWEIVRMTPNPPGPKFTHWQNDLKTTTDREYLNLGYLGQPIGVTSYPHPNETTYEALPLIYFRPGATEPLEDGYYRPYSGSHETFDAFIYESASKTATILQVATARRTPSVKEGDFRWLQSLGVENFRYIAVSTPHTRLDLPFPNEWNEGPSGALIRDVYILPLESLI